MIQFNLLPEVKKEYVKARRAKRFIISLSTLLSVGSIVVVVLLYGAVQWRQRGHIDNLTKDINEQISQIQSIENVNQILTIQNQLNLLPGLHEQKPSTSRMFSYLSFITPQEVNVQTLALDLELQTLRIEGSADTIATINRFVDNVKATRYVTDENSQERLQPFTNIVTELSGNNEDATFRVNMAFDPVIFDNQRDITMFLGDQFLNPDQIGDI